MMVLRPLAVLVGLAALAAAPYAASNMALAGPATALSSHDEHFAQAAKPQARPKIRVQPRYPYRRAHSFYPTANYADYPGPKGVRHCVSRYVTERRPSGNVVVPRVRCTWVVRR
jgi:hypothetical protein